MVRAQGIAGGGQQIRGDLEVGRAGHVAGAIEQGRGKLINASGLMARVH